jgi:hypothetical protein
MIKNKKSVFIVYILSAILVTIGSVIKMTQGNQVLSSVLLTTGVILGVVSSIFLLIDYFRNHLFKTK